jgi:predicted  nucleic acid-binding Zn-ribbon protein
MEPSDAPTDPESPSLDNTNSSDPPLSTPSTSPTGTHPSTPSLTNVPLTIEDRLAQLQATLTQINTERETLSASLKSAKRDSQKADGALRSDIDALKRASEKHAAADARAKQRILSLQEAVKRAQTATCETEALVTEVQGVLPGLNKKRADKEEEYDKIKGEADRVRNERALEAEKEKKRIESMRSELSALNNKLEKLHGKKEKLETGIIADLEEQLKEVECEVEKAEMESYVNIYAPAAARAEPTVEEIDTAAELSHSLPYLSTQRVRHQTFPAGTIGRPPPVPIQRPPSSEAPFGQLWTHPVSPRLSQTTHQTHNQRSSSLHHQTPILLTNPRRRKSSVSTPPQSHVQTSNPAPSSSTTTSATTLSSKAPAFEPGRSLKTVNSNATGVGAFAGTTGGARGVHTKAHSTPQSWLGR